MSNLRDRIDLFLEGISTLGMAAYMLFYYIQENAYGRENFLKFISDALNNQTSGTTFLFVLSITAIWVRLYLRYADRSYFRLVSARVKIHMWTTIPLLVYESYEIYQMLHPTYHDNYVMDMVLAASATTIILIIIFIKARM